MNNERMVALEEIKTLSFSKDEKNNVREISNKPHCNSEMEIYLTRIVSRKVGEQIKLEPNLIVRYSYNPGYLFKDAV